MHCATGPNKGFPARGEMLLGSRRMGTVCAASLALLLVVTGGCGGDERDGEGQEPAADAGPTEGSEATTTRCGEPPDQALCDRASQICVRRESEMTVYECVALPDGC